VLVLHDPAPQRDRAEHRGVARPTELVGVLDGVEPARASELGPSIVAERLEQTALTLVPAYRRAGPDTRLTERELEVLRVLAAGSTERDAAAALFV
jgi:DNA-binding NarL/FixJ family response regulator